MGNVWDNMKTIHKNAYGKKKVYNEMQLRRTLPRKYKDYRMPVNLREYAFPEEGADIAVFGTITQIDETVSNSGKQMTIVRAVDPQGTPFRITYMYMDRVATWLAAISSGPILFMGQFKNHPYFGYTAFNATFTEYPNMFLRINPIYSKFKGVSEKMMKQHIAECMAMQEIETVPDVLRPNYPEINTALRIAHYPQTMEEITYGKRRLILDDIIYTKLMMQKAAGETTSDIAFNKTDKINELIASLPYSLTPDQARTIADIVKHTQNHEHVRALVMGDVGCGKTIIAFALMVNAAENGYQSILMAPTQVLALQHYTELCGYVGEEKIAYFSGKTTAKQKKEYLQKIKDGSISYIIGTSSILFSDIEYCNPGLAIVDEEHRFGVGQRGGVFLSGIHTITMSATPIPRSLAHAIFGNTALIYEIKTKPLGRKDPITLYDDGSHTDQFIMQYLAMKMQVYIICALKDEDADSDILSAEEEFIKIQRKYTAFGYTCARVTGETPAKEKDAIMQKYHDGEIDILVSTTVIEVGVNVPNANLIIINNAERFGLATLHQLRGRVGRGSAQATCLLVSKEETERIMVMERTCDGFEIAKEDLLLRKGGDLIGDKQSGNNIYTEEIIMNPDIANDAESIVAVMSDEQKQAHMIKYEAERAQE